jgi:hypothetical protein
MPPQVTRVRIGRFASFAIRLHLTFHEGLQRRQMILDDIPNRIDLCRVIGMGKQIGESFMLRQSIPVACCLMLSGKRGRFANHS